MNYIKKYSDKILFYIFNVFYFSVRIIETFKEKETGGFQCAMDLLMFIMLIFMLSEDIKIYKKQKEKNND